MKVNQPDPPAPPREPAVELESYALVARLASEIQIGAASSPRSVQVTIGASEVGGECDRQIVYRQRGTPAVNHPDPLRSLVGVGFHLAVGEIFRRLSGTSGRYLVEQVVEVDGIPGTTDVYDRWTREVIDWKTTLLKSLRQKRVNGPSMANTVQAQFYAQGLRAMGEDPANVALVHVPVDGTLADMWAWRVPVDPAVVEMAKARLARLRELTPEQAQPKPSPLCPWCKQYQPLATDPNVGCPGGTERNKR